MRVQVDKAGGNDLAGGIDSLFGAGHRNIAANFDDLAVAHADVAAIARGLHTVDDHAALDDEVIFEGAVHRKLSMFCESSRFRWNVTCALHCVQGK